MTRTLANTTFSRILIIKPSAIGDIVHALPVLHFLRRRFPQADIRWLVNSAFADLLADHEQLNAVLHFDRKRYGYVGRNLTVTRRFFRFVRHLRSQQFDLVVDLQGLFRSGFFAWATGAQVRIGPASVREGAGVFYTHRIPKVDAGGSVLHPLNTPLVKGGNEDVTHSNNGTNEQITHSNTGNSESVTQTNTENNGDIDRSHSEGTSRNTVEKYETDDILPAHAVDKLLAIGQLFGVDHIEPHFELTPTRQAAHSVQQMLHDHGIGVDEGESFAVLVPGASAESKRWAVDRFVEAGNHLAARHGLKLVIAGSGSEHELAAQCASSCGGDAVNLAGRTSLSELVALIDMATIVVCNDSGPMHIAAARNTRLVAIFGPTDPARTGPYGRFDSVVNDPPGPLTGSWRQARKRVWISRVYVDAVCHAIDAQMQV